MDFLYTGGLTLLFEYYRLFNECIEEGLIVKGISVHLGRNKEVSFKRLKIELS